MTDDAVRLLVSGALPEDEWTWHLTEGEGGPSLKHKVTTSLASRKAANDQIELLVRFHILDHLLQPGREPVVNAYKKDVVLSLNQTSLEAVSVHVTPDTPEPVHPTQITAAPSEPGEARQLWVHTQQVSPGVLFRSR